MANELATLKQVLALCGISRATLWRGTAATMFAAGGYTDLQIDLFMGWTQGESAGIRRKYLSARNVALALTDLLGDVGAAISGVASDASAAG